MYYMAMPKNNEKAEHLCGTSWQIFIKDLKTVRGILRRYSDWIERAKRDARRVEIYALNYDDIYKDFDKYYTLVYIS